MSAVIERRGGSAAPVLRRLRVTGRGLGEPFAAFARARAARLALDLDVLDAGGTAVTMRVAGPAHVIDMLEMAALLGPLDAAVEGIETVDEGVDERADGAMDGAGLAP